MISPKVTISYKNTFEKLCQTQGREAGNALCLEFIKTHLFITIQARFSLQQYSFYCVKQLTRIFEIALLL